MFQSLCFIKREYAEHLSGTPPGLWYTRVMWMNKYIVHPQYRLMINHLDSCNMPLGNLPTKTLGYDGQNMRVYQYIQCSVISPVFNHAPWDLMLYDIKIHVTSSSSMKLTNIPFVNSDIERSTDRITLNWRDQGPRLSSSYLCLP